MLDARMPDLTFPTLEYGEYETPLDLHLLLYEGTKKYKARSHLLAEAIDRGKLGRPKIERLELVTKLHAEMHATVVGGGSKNTTKATIRKLRSFFEWATDAGQALTLLEIESTYRKWADHLLHRVRVVKDISMNFAYHQAATVGTLIDRILERRRIIATTSLTYAVNSGKGAHSVAGDKQNLEHTFAFGHVLADICDGLNLKALWGPLPVVISVGAGKKLVEWSKLRPLEKLTLRKATNSRQRKNISTRERIRAAHEADQTLRTRYPLVNLRIEAEMLIFIAQTGMNLADAHTLRKRHYWPAKTDDGWEFLDFKERRKGPVFFKIFSEYKDFFERYLEWRDAVFPDDPNGLLFPLVTFGRHEDTAPNFYRLDPICKKLGIKMIRPRALRRTRVNWLLRRSRDPDLTSDMAQHHKQTLHTKYEEPNLQVAIGEIVRFWNVNDPHAEPPSPGDCAGKGPDPIHDIPTSATKPDCIHPSGCLWCNNLRDPDSEDHVWSLCSFRFLKAMELANFRPPQPGKNPLPPHPAALAVERITQKITFFKNSSALRALWVKEGQAKVDEGDYHPGWAELIGIQRGNEG